MGSIPHEKGQFVGKGSHIVKCIGTEPCIKRLNRSIHVWVVDCGGRKEAQVQPYSPGVERHLANTIEPFICGGDAVLCQITLTTCFCLLLRHRENSLQMDVYCA